MLLALVGAGARRRRSPPGGPGAARGAAAIGFPIKFETQRRRGRSRVRGSLGVGCGVSSAWRRRCSWRASIRSPRSRRSATRGRSRLRNALMAVEVALALVVLVAAGLFLRSFIETRDTDPGFRREGVLLAAYDFSGRNTETRLTRTFATRLLERLRALPGGRGGGDRLVVPLDIHGLPMRTFTLEGRARPSRRRPGADQHRHARLFHGDGHSASSRARTSPTSRRVGAAPGGRERGVRPPLPGRPSRSAAVSQPRGRSYTIAGVARNSLYNAFGEPPTPVIYFSYRDRPPPIGEIHLRTRAGAETALAPDVRGVVRDLDPELPVYDVRTLSDHIEKNLSSAASRRGCSSCSARCCWCSPRSASTRSSPTPFAADDGDRRAARARRDTGGRRRAVRRESLLMVGLGALAGWLVAFAASSSWRRARRRAFAGVPALLLAVAAAACWLSARRAARSIRLPRCGSSRGVDGIDEGDGANGEDSQRRNEGERRRTKAVTLRLPAPREARLGDASCTDRKHLCFVCRACDLRSWVAPAPAMAGAQAAQPTSTGRRKSW